MKSSLLTLFTAVAIAALPHTAFAQARADRPAGDGIEIMTGVMSFDFHGVGTTAPVSIRMMKAITDRVALEAGTTVARPQETFGRSTFAAPETVVSYSWRIGRVRPFVSGGAGASVTRSAFGTTEWHPTLLGGGGARVQLGDRLYAVGEMRVRAVSRNGSASTAEWLGGVGWKLW